MCVDIVSLGNVARSTTRTRYPFWASSIAVGEPAQRAPTTMASYWSCAMSLPPAADDTPGQWLVRSPCNRERVASRHARRDPTPRRLPPRRCRAARISDAMGPPMSILVVPTRYLPHVGGIETLLRHTLPRLREQGYDP